MPPRGWPGGGAGQAAGGSHHGSPPLALHAPGARARHCRFLHSALSPGCGEHGSPSTALLQRGAPSLRLSNAGRWPGPDPPSAPRPPCFQPLEPGPASHPCVQPHTVAAQHAGPRRVPACGRCPEPAGPGGCTGGRGGRGGCPRSTLALESSAVGIWSWKWRHWIRLLKGYPTVPFASKTAQWMGRQRPVFADCSIGAGRRSPADARRRSSCSARAVTGPPPLSTTARGCVCWPPRFQLNCTCTWILAAWASRSPWLLPPPCSPPHARFPPAPLPAQGQWASAADWHGCERGARGCSHVWMVG
jgi:hypothetical protein